MGKVREGKYTPNNWTVVNRRLPESDHCQYRHRYRVSVSAALSIVVLGIGSTVGIVLSLCTILSDLRAMRYLKVDESAIYIVISRNRFEPYRNDC